MLHMLQVVNSGNREAFNVFPTPNPIPLALDTWMHFAWVFQPSSQSPTSDHVKLYYNGNLLSQSPGKYILLTGQRD